MQTEKSVRHSSLVTKQQASKQATMFNAVYSLRVKMEWRRKEVKTNKIDVCERELRIKTTVHGILKKESEK